MFQVLVILLIVVSGSFAAVIDADLQFTDDSVRFFPEPNNPGSGLKLICPSYDPNYVRFLLYTKPNTMMSSVINGAESPSKWDSFDAAKVTKILIHGWFQVGNAFGGEIRNAYFARDDYNIINVDWGNYSGCGYIYIKNNILPKVGLTLADLIRKLVDEKGASFKLIHLIGHSFGAHISGFAAKSLKPSLVARITGLDPAGLFYRLEPAENRLNSGDAEFVDIIHTNQYVLGIQTSIGHIDFRPNGGDLHPGCRIIDVLCQHEMSFKYFAESITYPLNLCSLKADNYVGYLARIRLNKRIDDRDYVYMGENVSQSARGDYYLYTKSTFPYGPCARVPT